MLGFKRFAWFLPAALITGVPPLAAENPAESRTIHLRQDDAQVRFASKVYELKHVEAEELLPFVNSAIRRYSVNSTVRRVTSKSGSPAGALLVSTGRDFLPQVDAIIAALDRPGQKDASGLAIRTTGICRVAYAPKYRVANEFASIIDNTLSSSAGRAYVNGETNTIFWRDQSDAAKRTLEWVKKLDRPLPQVKLRVNYYELRDSDLKDWGFDYLAWKNGPGVNLLNLGYNAGQLYVNEMLETATNLLSSSWGFGGFFTAPQFDMSFIRCLQQSGNANVAANGMLAMINTPVSSEAEYLALKAFQERNPAKAPFIYSVGMEPEYQNIAKNVLGRTFVGKSYYEDDLGVQHADPPALEVKVVNPFICLPTASGKADAEGFVPPLPAKAEKALRDKGGVLFEYALFFKSVIERGNTGSELSNSAVFCGAATLAFNREKLLAVYEKENDVEQTLGLPVLCRIPILKYLFSTVTTIQERSYIVVTAEATLLDLNEPDIRHVPESSTRDVIRRIENPFRTQQSK